jgi:hypothetical protein
MGKVKFHYDLKKDAWSWVLIAKDKDLWGLNWRDQVGHISDELLEKIKKASFSRAQKIVEEYINSHPEKEFKAKVRLSEMITLEKIWRTVEKKYFRELSKLTGRSIYRKDFSCYFTTGLMCPYNEKENWFMVSMWHSIPSSITTICHELMHLQFLFHYRKYLENSGLREGQIQDLKEAITFLLNEKEFESIILCSDNGYPEHQKLRKKLQKIWEKEKDFTKFLDRAIEIVKNE